MSMFAPSYDVEPEFPEILRKSSHVARRHHTGTPCSMCHKRIMKGQSYEVVVGVDTSGDFFIDKTHDHCRRCTDWY